MKAVVNFIIIFCILIGALPSAAAEAVTGTAEQGKYTWNFISGGPNSVYSINDEYAELRVSLGDGDGISEGNIVYSGPSCKEKTDTGYTSAADTGRYILVKPAYSGTMYIKISFTSAKSSTKGRIWYNDFGKNAAASGADLSALQKGAGTQIGDDFTDTYERTLSFAVEAGHLYSLHTYVYLGGAVISELYYTSDEIAGKTAAPVINEPIAESDTSISGTCAENAEVTVRVNNGEVRSAAVSGTKWMLEGLKLKKNDIIYAAAKAGDYKESDTASVTVMADEDVCTLTIADTPNGTVTSNIGNGGRAVRGSTVTLTVVPDNKYKLAGLTVNGVIAETDENDRYSFIITEDTDVSAAFEEKPYYVISLPRDTKNGSISIKGGAEITDGVYMAVEGERVLFDITAADGYRIKSLTYTGADGEAHEFKYGGFFYMPACDVSVNAEFKEEEVVSYIDTTFGTYDRLTMLVDGEPFFYSGIQVRADNAIDKLKFNDEQVKDMYLRAGKDGFTVVNSQVRWTDVQPETELWASETGTLNGAEMNVSNDTVTADNNTPAYFTFTLPKTDADYAAVKFRLRISNVTADTALSVYEVTDSGLSESKITSPNWNIVTTAHISNTNEGSNGYFDFNVAGFVNGHKDGGEITLAVKCENESTAVIYGAASEGNSRPQLKLSRDDVYDWTYLDKLLDNVYEAGVKFELLWFATDTCQQSHEERVPYYVHENYQKSLKSDGTPARKLNAENNYIMCKNDLDLRAKEKEVLETVFDHIAEYTEEKGYGSLVIGCQVANETAVGRFHAGTDDNKYFGHCYCDACMERLASSSSESAFREDTLWEYLNNLASAVKESNYSVWTRQNNYMTTDTNVLAYNEQKRSAGGTDLDFIGIDPYSVTGGAGHDYIYSFGHETCTYKNHTYNYAQGKNLPMVMEFGGNNQDLDESILACIAGGGWLNVYELLSGSEDYGIYTAVRDNNGNAAGFAARTGYTYSSGSDANWSEENWIDRIRNLNYMLGKVKYQLASKKPDGAGGDSLMFFNPKSDETVTSSEKNVRALGVTYNTENNGVGIAIEQSDRETVLLSTKPAEFLISGIGAYGRVTAESGYYNGDEWVSAGEKTYTADGDNITISMDGYECVRILTAEPVPAAPVIEAVSGTASEGKYTWRLGAPAETEGAGVYDYSDEYAKIRIAAGTGDSLTRQNGLWWSGPSCRENDSAADTNRYILVRPAYSGKLTVTIRFAEAAGSRKSRIWYNDFGTDITFDAVDTSTLKKSAGTQIGGDITDKYEHTLSFDVEAGHLYSLHTYNSGSYIADMYYESDDITIEPVSLENISVGGDGSLSAELVYNKEDIGTVSVIAAEYDSGALVNVRSFAAAEGLVDFEGYSAEKGTEVKLFVWDSLEGMKPMSKVHTVTY